MIGQGKLDHFLLKPQQLQLPPPPPREEQRRVQETTKKGETFVIEVGPKARNLQCNSIIHSYKTVEDFHDNILSRVHARDCEGREILNIAKLSPLKDWQMQIISFSATEVPGDGEMHDHPLVVKLEVYPNPRELEDEEEVSWGLSRILVDTGSSVNIMFYHAYKTMKGRDEDLIASTYKIYGFNGTANKPRGEIKMRIILDGMETEILFCVVDVESPYNALIGRPWIHDILGVASTFHQAIKFPHPKGIGMIKGDWAEGKKCYDIEMESCEERLSEESAKKKRLAEIKRGKQLMLDE